MNPRTNTFLSVASLSAAVNGPWFAVPSSPRTHIPISLSLQAGTATWAVQGRNSAADDAVELDTGSADNAISVLRMAQMRVILSAATGATFRATGDMPMIEIL